MARNMPYRRIARGKGHLFYAWMYAPEANATAETWEQVFGHRHGAVPALHDEVNMPEGMVSAARSVRVNDVGFKVLRQQSMACCF